MVDWTLHNSVRRVGRYVSFEKWQVYLVACFIFFLLCFFLAPTREFRMRWFYYTVTPISAMMLIFRGQKIFAADGEHRLKWFALLTFLFFIPFLWTQDVDYLRTVRHGVERWLYVFSFGLAVFYCVRSPRLVSYWIPRLLVACGVVALGLLFYNVVTLQRYHNVVGMLTLASNPNQTGMPLGVACVLCMSLWFSGHLSWRRSLAWGGLTALFALGIWFTTARSAMLGVLVVGAFVLYLKTRYKWVLVLPIIVVIAAIIYVIFNLSHPEHYMLSGRMAIWQHIWEAFKANPWFGVGAKSSYAVVRIPQKLEAHSLYFSVAYYAGSLGLVVLFALLWCCVKCGLRASKEIRWVYFPLLVYGLTVHLVEGIYPLYEPHPFWLFTWLPILVLLMSVNNTPQQSTEVCHVV